MGLVKLPLNPPCALAVSVGRERSKLHRNGLQPHLHRFTRRETLTSHDDGRAIRHLNENGESEAHPLVQYLAAVADRVDDGLHSETHREHSVGEHAEQPNGDGRAPTL